MSKPKVLLIDNDAVAHQLFERVLNQSRCQLIRSEDVRDGMRQAMLHRPELVVLEADLPESEGLTFVRQLRELVALRRTPVMLFTAHSSRERLLEARQLELSDYILKPSDEGQLASRLGLFFGWDVRTGQPFVPPEQEHRPILLIDDHPSYLEALQECLSDWEHPLVAAHDGESGLKLARQLLPGLILLDISLPDMSGLTVLEHLRQDPLTQAVPVLVLTGDNSENCVRQAIAGGARGYILKPFQLPFLLAQMERHL
jgi:CheY-like chemotaxis protein